jgi:hypothetical protein
MVRQPLQKNKNSKRVSYNSQKGCLKLLDVHEADDHSTRRVTSAFGNLKKDSNDNFIDDNQNEKNLDNIDHTNQKRRISFENTEF